MSSTSVDDDAVESDPRLLFIYTYLSKTTKFKIDKWQKMMNTDTYKSMIMDFLEKPQLSVLLVTLTSAGTLVPSLTFPTSGKTKSSYFARVKAEPITAENIRKCLIFGDISPRPLDDLAVLVEEVFVPVFSNPANHKGWPAVVVDDVKKHVIELKNTVYKVRGQINGQTLLPMPDGVSRVHQVEQRIIESNGEDVDLQLKSAIEGVVIKWVTQITEVLQETPSSVHKSLENPLPYAETDFWRSRVSNLECIYDQLRDPRVKKMASILELTDSAYYPSFRTVFRNVVAAVKEAKEISKYLKPLEKSLNKLDSVEFNEADTSLRPLLHIVCLVWANCKYYCSSAKVTHLLQLIANQLIDMANKFLDPTSLFQGEVQETIVKVEEVIAMLEKFKEMFEESRGIVTTLFPEDVEPVPWLFHSKIIFNRLNAYLQRLRIIDEFFEIAIEYSKLEKVEIGGLNGRHLGAKVASIFDEFNVAFNIFRSVSYNPAEPEDDSFITDYKVFKEKVLDMDRRMAAICSLAFNECHNLESIFKMISVWDTMLKRPIIKAEISPKYDIIIEMLNNELDVVKTIYNDQMDLYEKNGFITVDRNWPPVAGGLVWVMKMINRITNPVDSFKQFENPIVSSPEGEYALVKYDEMAELLKSLGDEIFADWCEKIPEVCNTSLAKTLLLVDADTRKLTLNFDKELDAGLREVRFMKLIGKEEIPGEAQELFERSDQLWQFTFNLSLTIDWYNQMRSDSKKEEFALVEEEVQDIDDLIDEVQSLLSWTSPNAWEYIQSIRDLVDQLASRVLRAQKNLARIISLMNTWSNTPLFNRHHLNKDNLLALEEAPDKVNKRYTELYQAGLEVSKLVAENFRLYFNVPLREPPPALEEAEGLEDELYEELIPPPKDDTEAPLEDDQFIQGENEDVEGVGQPAVDAETGEAPAALPSDGEEVPPEATMLLDQVGDEAEGSATRLSKTSKITTGETDKGSKALKQSLEETPSKKPSKDEKKPPKDIQEEKKTKPGKPTKEKESPKKKIEAPTSPKMKGKKGKEIKKKESIPPPEPSLELSMSEEMIQKVVDDEEKIAKWNDYLNMVDDEVLFGLSRAVDCSLGLFVEEMNPVLERAPLFEVSLELQNTDIVFVPSLDLDSDSPRSFYNTISGLLDDITHMAIRVPRVSYQRLSVTYLDNIIMSPDVSDMKSETLERVKAAAVKATEYSAQFEDYNYLWLDDRRQYLKQFLMFGHALSSEEELLEGKINEEGALLLKESPPKLNQFKIQIDEYEELYKELSQIEQQKIFDQWLRVDNQPFKQALLNTVCKWGNMFKQHLVDHVINSLKELADFIEEADKGLSKPLVEGDYNGLLEIMGYLMKVKERQIETDNMFEPLKDVIELVKVYDMDFPEETYVLLQDLPGRWNNTKKIAVGIKAAAMPLMQAEANTIRKRLVLFDLRQNLYRDNFRRSAFFKWGCKDVYRVIDRTNFEVADLEDAMQKLIEQASLFEVIIPEFKIIKSLRKELKMSKVLWDYILIVLAWISDWEGTPWKKIDSETMDLELKKFAKEIRMLDKEMRVWDIYLQLEAVIKNMITALRAVTELQNPALRSRHWKQLMEAAKMKFMVDDKTTLADLLALQLYKIEDDVKTIVDKSVKEMSMEKTLGELAHTWASMEFEYEVHPRTGCKVLKVSEELVEILEDNQVQLQNMMSSKFIAYFLEEVSEWQRKLSNADQVIHIWLEVQRTWMHLESIFVGSEDIRKQLPEDSKRFDKIDKEFRGLLEDISKTPNVVKATNKAGLYEKLESLQSELVKCEKALAEYLETKRLAYPRFYFVSSADLLDILSNGNQPELVCRHLTKLYDSIAKLKFITEGNKTLKVARGMFAKDGEYVEFNANCDCGGQVEKWLNNVTDSMRATGRFYFAEAVVTYDEKPREQWLFDYPAQCALCGTQIWWTTEVNMAFARLEEGYENALKDYQKKQISQLNTLIGLLLGDLSVGDRQKIMTICTIDVHSRDVVAKMILMKIETSSAFQWQSQLRHRWDVKVNDCFANICDAQFRYDYEYLGNTPRLVITPLTDRCYITLTQSLHLIMGGAPAGPAGTGKTETTKDLGKAIGIMVYVFNCSEQMDYKSCGNIYKGLAQTGAWGCFDEFNRISVEVLSVVAVQVKCVLDAIKAKKTKFNFLGELITLIPTVGMFITMNPGYAGRAELPENLKALFRPCAMVVPDFELICEIMLVAEGFQEARLLARKFITLYSLCKELLSKQDHYDWGLRAIKSVLVVAGSLKRGDRQRPEDQVLMRALRDFNIPKIVTDDMQIFMGLIGDLFPALDVPRKRDMDFEKQVRQAAIDLKLQPEDNFVLKIVQLQELFAVRHSVFIIGIAGAGKSQVWKTLYRTYYNQKRKPLYNDLEPKAVTNDELFGIINPATREWKDGLFSVLIREQANMGGDGPKWMVLDGDIDPMWIESLNTVMDDNKVLTLASNERIALSPAMRLLFEISNLRTATPATVSRAGILFINPQDLGWNPYVTSWIETRENENEKAVLIVLFDKYIPPVLEASRSKYKKITPIPEIAHVQMLCTLLESLLTPSNVPPDCPKEWYEIYFVFACVWAFGSCTFQDQLVDWRSEFTKWWCNEFKAVKFPSAGHVFNYYIDPETKRFMPWTDKVAKFDLHSSVTLQLVDWRSEFTKWWCNEFKAVKFPSAGHVFNYYIDPETKRFMPWTDKVAKFDLHSSVTLQLVDWRSEFTKWWCNEFKAVKFPSAGHVFNYYIDPETKRFMPWTDKVAKFDLHSSVTLQLVDWRSEFTKWWCNEFKAVKFPSAGHVFNYYIDPETKRFMPWTDKVAKIDLHSSVTLQLVDWRSEFTKWWCNEFKAVKFPSAGHVFNYYIDPETKRFMPWTDKVAKFDLHSSVTLQLVDWRSEFTKWWCNEFKAVKFPSAGHVFNYYIDPETKRFMPWTDKVAKFDLHSSVTLQLVDWRSEFTKWWCNEFKAVKFPSAGHVFNYYIDPETKRFMPWTDKVAKFELDTEVPLQATLVNTAETTRVRYFLDLLIDKRKPVMLVGGAGSGKSVIIGEKLNSLSENYAVTNVPFNFYTTSEMLQKVLEKPLEKKAGRNYGPPGSKVMIYFLDDMNMPEVDKYGTVQPHTLIRQWMDYQHWYDRTKLTLKEIHNIIFFSCMNPTAGSFTIDPRLQRHFMVFALSFPGPEALFHIYNNILSQHLTGHSAKFSTAVVKSAELITHLALAMHARMSTVFLPTAVKFHYVFNLRDLANIYQGMLFCTNECLTTPGRFVRLWMHEATRVYCDKLVDHKDQDTFHKLMTENVKKVFAEMPESEYIEKPLIFCHFVDGLGDPKYLPMPTWTALNKLLVEAMSQYNDLVGAMNLVLFEDAMSHVCRINRIMEGPRGNALLVGVGGSGKQSLSRLSAFISGLDPFQVQLKKGYGMSDLKSDLAALYLKAGLKNVSIMFLMTDSQVADEKFLVLINDMLASGEIPELFADDEVDNIISAIGAEVKGSGLQDTRENCWKYFINKVRRLIKVILCFSPVGSTLRVRSRKFPAVVNCTSIDWFMEWPQEALRSVSLRFLSEIDVLPTPIRKSVSVFMAFVHTSVNNMSKVYLDNERRYNYTTPKSFLELINLYSKLLQFTVKDCIAKTRRLQNGLKKLVGCSDQVEGLKSQLAEQERIIVEKTKAATELIKIVGKEQDKVAKEKIKVAEEERKVKIMEEDIMVKQKVCEEDLEKAEPALTAAMAALNTLNKNNLTELKSFGSPPSAVVKICEAVMVLFSKGKLPRDRSWKACKVMMGALDKFLSSLVNYDKENVHPDSIKELYSKYLVDPEFDPEFVMSKSSAAAGLCSWVINIHAFHLVWMVVLPKRKALAQANQDLAAARAKLAELKAKLQELELELAILTKKFEDAVADKLRCETEAEKTAETIDLANRLVNGLASENQRWKDTVANLQKQSQTLPGDMLIVTAFISYVGCFTRKYRLDLMYKDWFPFVGKLKPAVPISPDLDPLSLLTDEAQIAQWQNFGLPSDRMSTENATILTNSERWPLMIDPQLQGIKWIKSMYGNKLNIIRLGQKNYLDRIEKALSDGSTILIENIGESVDPVLDSLLGRNLIKKGRAVKIGDKEMDFNPKFRLILHTKLANPHYKPELQAQTTLINFTVTRDGLEEQLLAEVVKAERPDLESLKAELTKQQNVFKITLKQLEDDLLQRLAGAGPDILGDKELVINLEKTKRTADEISVKVAEAKVTSCKIDEAREMYRPAATRASILYFILNDLNKINPIYQFSLKAFSVVFQNAIAKADPSESLVTRVHNLVDFITFFVFMYTSRGLFECDKLIFMAQMAIQVLLNSGEISSEELDFLLRFPFVPNLTSPVEFLTHQLWGGIKALINMDVFRNLDKDIEGSQKRWKKFIEGECPERDKFPQDWKNKTALQRLCMMRSMRPDRMTYAVRCFIEEKLGTKYTEARTIEFSKSFEESSCTVPVFFILSPGVDPTRDVESVGKKMGFTTDKRNFHNVSLGQGQEVVAEQTMEACAHFGHWVILQNIHLVKNWLPILEKKMEACSENPHPDFRLFISAEPAASAEYHIIPQGVLESSIKITNEPPTGMLANLHKAMDNFNQDTLEMCSKEAEFKAILFSLCYFHAVVAERRKFGAQGWNRTYPFNVGDLTISVHVLYNYLENSSKVPWEDLRYLFGEIMYGGHITDDWDRRLCRTYLQEYLSPELVEGDLFYAPGFPSPPNMDYLGYHNYIDDMLPPESPNLYGLHTNAEIGFLTTLGDNLFRTIFELQPREAGASASGGISREEKVKQILDDIADKIPDPFNIADMMARVEERTPYIIVAFQECERMNNLMSEIRRSLKELSLGLKGELTITSEMEVLEGSLFMDNVPEKWTKLAYPSLLGLGAWFSDLMVRLRELESWVGDFNLPSSVWLAGFFNPQSFLTAIMQSTARKNEWPLDKMCLQCDVTKKQKEEFTSPPREGAYINGLFMEGARWDTEFGCISTSKLKELFPMMPVVFVKAITQDKQETRNIYECPVYKTRQRGPTFVWTFNLKTKEKASKWTLAGVAILLCV